MLLNLQKLLELQKLPASPRLPASTLVHMQAMQPMSAYERRRIDKIAENRARLAAVQSQQPALLTENGNARDTTAVRGSKKGKRHHGQENNSQVLFCCCCPTLVVHG